MQLQTITCAKLFITFIVIIITRDYLRCITTKAIIESLTKDGRFKSVCKSIAKKPYLADDLYQEFFLALCEIKDNRLVEAKEGGYLEVLCVGVINNIWGKRYRVKMRDVGQTHPLHEHCNSMKSIQSEGPDHNMSRVKNIRDVIPEHHMADVSEPYEENDPEEVKKALEKSMNSADPSERFRARVFYYSIFKYKNPRQFAINSGIPYNICLEANNIYKEKLRQKVCI